MRERVRFVTADKNTLLALADPTVGWLAIAAFHTARPFLIDSNHPKMAIPAFQSKFTPRIGPQKCIFRFSRHV
jgi:hypothetical protein